MVGDQHADVPFLQLGHDALDVLHGDRVHPGEGLVQQDEARVGGQRPGDLGAASFPTAQHIAAVGAHMPEPELGDQ